MDWFYAVNDQQNGPVSEARLDELLRSGAINGDTLVWRKDLPGWQPLHIARPPPSPPPDGGLPSVVCVECRRAFSPNDVVLLNQSWVCAQCKPVFVQRLREGIASGRGGVWRFNRQIVMQPETPLPDRCIRCNASANGFRLKRQLYWHPGL